MPYINCRDFLRLKLHCYVWSTSLGGTVIYSFDNYTIFYCITIWSLVTPPPPKRTFGLLPDFTIINSAAKTFVRTCFLLNIGPCTSVSLCSTTQPMPWRAFLMHAPWLEFKGVPHNPQKICLTEALWKSNVTLWQEKEKVPKWRENNGNYNQN